MSLYALSAEACAAAALGETVISLLRVKGQTVLAVEYAVEPGDGLAGQLIGNVEYGYNVVAIMYQQTHSDDATFFPSADIRLEAGSRFVVLANIQGLQNVEHKSSACRNAYVRLIQAVSPSAEFEAACTLVRVTGCDLAMARAQMNQLPATFPMALFAQQASRLVRELGVAGVKAEVSAQDTP